jgi:PadR family transcriptional regulator PadR
MDTQLKKGLLEICVLRYLSSDPSYGYEIMLGVSQQMPMSESTLYSILSRLASSGYLTTYREEHDGRLRKYYEITRDGVIRLDEFRAESARVEKILSYIRGGHND